VNTQEYPVFATGATPASLIMRKLRTLAVRNVIASYQIDGKYPLECYYHSGGKRLISPDRLPEKLQLYATKGSKYTNEPLISLLRTMGSVTVSPGCILGTVVVDEISEATARRLFPNMVIMNPVTQILRLSSCVKWKQPLPVKFTSRFDRWPQASKDTEDEIRAHTQVMSVSWDDDEDEDGWAKLPTLPGTLPDTSKPLAEGHVIDIESESDDIEPPDIPKRHAMSTKEIDLHGKALIVRDNPQILLFQKVQMVGGNLKIARPVVFVGGCYNASSQSPKIQAVVQVVAILYWSSASSIIATSKVITLCFVLIFIDHSTQLLAERKKGKGVCVVAFEKSGRLVMLTLASLKSAVTDTSIPVHTHTHKRTLTHTNAHSQTGGL
jgi:hypothetical protein